ncbi:MAG: trehalose-6-phosphate synthase [Acidimicrobiia bacterium]
MPPHSADGRPTTDATAENFLTSGGPGPVVIVSGRAPYTATVSQNGIKWQRGNGGLAQGGFVLPPGSVFIANAQDHDDAHIVSSGHQPPRLTERGLRQIYLAASDEEVAGQRAFFGRVTWFLHHDMLGEVGPPVGGHTEHDSSRPLATDDVRHLFDAHVTLNMLAAGTVLRVVADIAEETGLPPSAIPVLVQDHHFDLVPAFLEQQWHLDDNPFRNELSPPSVLFVHTAIASTPHWERFADQFPDIARYHATRLANTQVSVHDTTWARQWVDNLRSVLGPDATLIEPWASAYPPNLERLNEIRGGKLFRVDDLDVHSKADGRRIIAAVGRVDPAKNFVALVQAFDALIHRRPDFRDNVVLMLQTSRPRDLPEYHEHEKALRRAIRAVNADAVDEHHDQLTPIVWFNDGSGHRAVSLELNADVLAFPSIKDGFGHAALEGYAVGSTAALVASPDTGATRWAQVHAGPDSVITIDPRSVDSISQGLEAALDTPRVARISSAALLQRSSEELVAHAAPWRDEQIQWSYARRVVDALRVAFIGVGSQRNLGRG